MLSTLYPADRFLQDSLEMRGAHPVHDNFVETVAETIRAR